MQYNFRNFGINYTNIPRGSAVLPNGPLAVHRDQHTAETAAMINAAKQTAVFRAMQTNAPPGQSVNPDINNPGLFNRLYVNPVRNASASGPHLHATETPFYEQTVLQNVVNSATDFMNAKVEVYDPPAPYVPPPEEPEEPEPEEPEPEDPEPEEPEEPEVTPP